MHGCGRALTRTHTSTGLNAVYQWHDRGVTFLPCSDLAAAEWIATSDEHWWKLVTRGPAGFPAYARLRFIPDPIYEGQSENDVDRPNGILSDMEQLRVAAGSLLGHTGSPSEGYLLIWDGWGEDSFPDLVLRAPRVAVPGREYYLCRVWLSDFVSGTIEDSWQAKTDRAMPPPAFIWPKDRAWCITQDVDPHWASIGAEQAMIDQLLTEPRLDVVQVEANQKLPFYF